MAGLAESLFPRSSKLGHLSGYHPRALLGAGLDVASLPGRAYASLGRMEDESYTDALGRTGPRYVVGQGEGDELADAILRDPLTPVGFGVGAAIKGLRPILGLGADLGTNAAGMAADQYATTGAVNSGEIGAGAGLGTLMGLPGMRKGGRRAVSRAIDPADYGLSRNADGTVTVYHHTNPSAADEILKASLLKSRGEPDVYFTTERRPVTGYGESVIAADVSPSMLDLDDEFPGGRFDFRAKASKPGGAFPIKNARKLTTDNSMISPEEREANFRNWFGDSKVVDEAGNPLVVHHGTYSGEFPVFDVSGDAGLHPTAKFGAFFTPSKEVAKEFGNRIESVYLNAKNPYEMSAEEYYNLFSREKEFDRLRSLQSNKAKEVLETAESGEGGIPDKFIEKRVKSILREMDERGNDALHVNAYDPDWDEIPDRALFGNWKELKKDVWVMRDPTQIKSATGNRGTFDPNDPNITHFAGASSAPSRNRATTRLERQAAQVAYDKYGRPREESAGRPVSTFQGLGSLLSSPSDTYYTRGGR